MDIRRYLAESERHYHFRLKTVVPLDDAAMDRIEGTLAKYHPVDITRPRKTMLQKHPMDFNDIMNREVYIVDVTVTMPASSYVLQQELRQVLNVPEKYIIVRGDNDPLEIQNEQLSAVAEIEAEAQKRGLRPAPLLADPAYGEAEPVDGAEYHGSVATSAFLDVLAKVQKERKDPRLDPPNPLFKWLDMPDRVDQEPVQPGGDYNAGIKDALNAPSGKTPGSPSGHGNLDDDSTVVSRTFVDDKGKRVVISRKIAGIRGGRKAS